MYSDRRFISGFLVEEMGGTGSEDYKRVGGNFGSDGYFECGDGFIATFTCQTY
jgi:hypothetical protein